MASFVVTNGRQSVTVPFEDGEMTAEALQRVLKFATPCHARTAPVADVKSILYFLTARDLHNWPVCILPVKWLLKCPLFD